MSNLILQSTNIINSADKNKKKIDICGVIMDNIRRFTSTWGIEQIIISIFASKSLIRAALRYGGCIPLFCQAILFRTGRD